MLLNLSSLVSPGEKNAIHFFSFSQSSGFYVNGLICLICRDNIHIRGLEPESNKKTQKCTGPVGIKVSVYYQDSKHPIIPQMQSLLVKAKLEKKRLNFKIKGASAPIPNLC